MSKSKAKREAIQKGNPLQGPVTDTRQAPAERKIWLKQNNDHGDGGTYWVAFDTLDEALEVSDDGEEIFEGSLRSLGCVKKTLSVTLNQK